MDSRVTSWMEPEEFRTARAELNLSQRELAEALGLSNNKMVDEMERGKRAVSGPIFKLLKIYRAGLVEPGSI